MRIRDIMTEAPRVVGEQEPIRRVAEYMVEDGIGSVIVRGQNQRLRGLITDRDIATQLVAAGMEIDSTVAADLLGSSDVITIDADDSVDAALEKMRQYAVRRLPVVDAGDLVGIVSQGDLAMHAAAAPVGGMVEAISEAPDNTGRA